MEAVELVLPSGPGVDDQDPHLYWFDEVAERGNFCPSVNFKKLEIGLQELRQAAEEISWSAPVLDDALAALKASMGPTVFAQIVQTEEQIAATMLRLAKEGAGAEVDDGAVAPDGSGDVTVTGEGGSGARSRRRNGGSVGKGRQASSGGVDAGGASPVPGGGCAEDVGAVGR